MFSNLFISKDQQAIQQANTEHDQELNIIAADAQLFRIQQQLLAANKTSEPGHNIINAFTALGKIISIGGMKDTTQTVILSDHIIVLNFDKTGCLSGITCDIVQ